MKIFNNDDINKKQNSYIEYHVAQLNLMLLYNILLYNFIIILYAIKYCVDIQFFS